MKKLVRINIDVWDTGLQIKEYPIVKETEHVVFIVRERERRNPETGYKETVRIAGPFNRKDIGVIFLCKPGTGKGTKKMYLITEAKDPMEDPEIRAAVHRMCDEICRELTDAGRALAEIGYTVNSKT